MNKIVVLIACILYVICPIDLLPDFFVCVGWIDDLFAIGFTIWWFIKGNSSGGSPELSQGQPTSTTSMQ